MLTIITITLGWKYYWLAFTVPVVMLINLMSIFLAKGRIVCGNFCPRGAFYDRILKKFSGKPIIPMFLRRPVIRWSIVVVMFGVFIIRIIESPFTLESFGRLFWVMCTITTVIGVALGFFFSHRTWCAICPIGTIINAANCDTNHISIDSQRCVKCKLCEKKCPMNIVITNGISSGAILDSDCIKCKECIAVCPKKALSIM